MGWGLIASPTGIWPEVLCSKYRISLSNLPFVLPTRYGSHLWKAISKVWTETLMGIRWSIGNGRQCPLLEFDQTTYMIHDTWYIFIMYIVQYFYSHRYSEHQNLTSQFNSKLCDLGCSGVKSMCTCITCILRPKVLPLNQAQKCHRWRIFISFLFKPHMPLLVWVPKVASQGHGPSGPNSNDRWNNQYSIKYIHEDTVCIELLKQYFHHSYSNVNNISIIRAEQKNYKEKK